jgi:hypothetical protein
LEWRGEWGELRSRPNAKAVAWLTITRFRGGDRDEPLTVLVVLADRTLPLHCLAKYILIFVSLLINSKTDRQTDLVNL